MPNGRRGEDEPFLPFPPDFDIPLPGFIPPPRAFPFPRVPPRPPPDLPEDVLGALPFPGSGGQGFPIPLPPPRPDADIRRFPSPAANEPFGGKTIRIGRILRGFGLGGIIIIASEILVEILERAQIREMGKIIERQDAEIAQGQIERLEERARQKEIEIEPGQLPLPELDRAPEIPPPAPPPRPEILPEISPARSPIFDFPPPPIRRAPPVVVPAPGPAPVALPVPGTFPGPAQVPLPRPLTTPLPGTRTLPVSFPIAPPIGEPLALRVGDPVTPALTGVEAGQVPSQQIGQFVSPQVAPEAQPQRCEAVKRRRRRKGKCREGFFKEFPGKTEFTSWREVECISRREIPEFGRRALEIVEGIT